MQLELLQELYAICQTDQSDDPVQEEIWRNDELFAIIKTTDEVTIIVKQDHVPTGAKSETDYNCFRVAEAMAFDVIGVIAGISRILAEAKIPIFVLSTFNTDYVFLKRKFMETAKSELQNNGYLWKD